MHQALEESYVREFIIYVTGISHFLRIIAKQLTNKEMTHIKRNKSNQMKQFYTTIVLREIIQNFRNNVHEV